jgi:Flp pilus assembly protein TadD
LEASRESLLVSSRLERDRVEVLELLGMVHGLLGELDEAVAALERAVVLDGDNWSTQMRLAGALADTGRLEEARTAYQAALRLNPYSADVLDRIGVFYTRLGELDFAVRVLRQAVEIEPDRGMFRVHLANALLMSGDHEEEVRFHLETAIELGPDSTWVEFARTWLDNHPAAQPD